jgi:hypothetical protein
MDIQHRSLTITTWKYESAVFAVPIQNVAVHAYRIMCVFGFRTRIVCHIFFKQLGVYNSKKSETPIRCDRPSDFSVVSSGDNQDKFDQTGL